MRSDNIPTRIPLSERRKANLNKTKKTVDTRWTLRYINSCPPRKTVVNAIVVQLVVRHLAKVEVASSSLVYRSRQRGLPNSLINAIVVQLVVRHLAKVEVASSSLVYRSQGTEDLGSFFLHNSELCAEREPAAAVYCSTVFYTIISLSNALIACKKFVNIIQCSRQANGRNAPH